MQETRRHFVSSAHARSSSPSSLHHRLGRAVLLAATLAGCAELPPDGADRSATDETAAAATQDATLVTSESALAAGVPRLRITVTDIGQGDGLVVQYPGGATLAIDGGPRQDDFSAALQRLGVKRLDYAVLSHAHTDHFTGLTSALDLLPSDCATRVYDPGLNRSDVDGYVAFKRAAGCRYKKVGIGQTLNLDPRVETTVLSAYAQKQSNDDSHGVNNTSVVLRLRYGRFSMLLSGDAEAEAEGGMVSGALPLRSTILKAGHHGSCTASSDGYLRAVKPKYIVISAGTGNNYGLPHCQTIAKYRAISGLRWARTDRNGALTIVSDGTRFVVKREHGAESDDACPRDCSDPIED